MWFDILISGGNVRAMEVSGLSVPIQLELPVAGLGADILDIIHSGNNSLSLTVSPLFFHTMSVFFMLLSLCLVFERRAIGWRLPGVSPRLGHQLHLHSRPLLRNYTLLQRNTSKKGIVDKLSTIGSRGIDSFC